MEKDWYNEISKRIGLFEHWHISLAESSSLIGSKIDWCYRFGKITERQMNELCDRYTEALKNR